MTFPKCFVTRHYLSLATWSFLGARKHLSSCVYFSMGYFDVLCLVGSACIFKRPQMRREQIKLAFLLTGILAIWGRFGGKKGSFAELLKWQRQTLPWWQNNDWHLWKDSRFTQFNLHFLSWLAQASSRRGTPFFPMRISNLRAWRPWAAQRLASIGRVRPWLKPVPRPSPMWGARPAVTHKAQTFKHWVCRNGKSRAAGFSDASFMGIKEWL